MFRIRPVTLLMASLLALSACSRGKSPEHLSFETPEAAVEALVAAAEKHDVEALRRILGPGADSLLITGDDVADRNERAAFIERYRAGHQLVAGGPNDLVLQVGWHDANHLEQMTRILNQREPSWRASESRSSAR